MDQTEQEKKLEYYLEASQGNVLLSILMKTMLDPQNYSASRINKFLGLVEQGIFIKSQASK
jgi:ribose 5-phosphate isomerase